MLNFSVIVPTYNREKELSELFETIFLQTLKPKEVIVIDDGNLPLSFIKEKEKKFEEVGIDFVYYKKDHSKERRGLSESKNIGLKLAKNEIVFILDDDIELEREYFQEIMKIWEANIEDKKLVGVGGWVKNQRKKTFLEKIYNKIFGLSSKIPWDVNDVGYQVWNPDLKEPIKCFYIEGCVSSFKKIAFEKIGYFLSFSGGRTALEDVELALRAKKSGFHFIITPQARAIHKKSKSSRENEFLIGFKESQNRKIIFKKHCQQDFFHRIWFFWASVGWVLRQFLGGNFRRGLGMIWGFVKSI